jgi:hypothetical protein
MSINNNRSEQSNYDVWDDNNNSESQGETYSQDSSLNSPELEPTPVEKADSNDSKPRVETNPQTIPPKKNLEGLSILSDEVQYLFQEQGDLPKNIKSKLDLIVSSLFHRIEQIDIELLKDDKFKDQNGSFIGYDHPEVKNALFAAFGLTVRDPKHLTDSGKLFNKVKNVFSPDILQKSHKSYIGKEVLSLLQKHAHMNHLAGLIGTVASLEIGEGILNQIGSFGLPGEAIPLASLVANFVGFKMIVDKNDDFLETEDVSLKAGYIERMKSLAIIWGMRSALIGATAFAGFIHLEKLDLQLYSDRAAQTILEDMSNKAEEDEINLRVLSRLNKLKSIKIPSITEVNEIKDIENQLKKKPASSEVLKVAQDRSLTPGEITALKERSKALFHQVGAMGQKGDAIRKQETEVEKAKVDEKISTATNAATATPISTTVYNEARNERLKLNSGEFVNKYVKYIVNKEKEDTFRQLVLENDPHKFSLSNKFQIAVDRLMYEYSHNKTYSLAINSLGAMFFESFSIVTMVVVLRNKKFQQLYSNNEFQSKYSSLISHLSTLVNEYAVEAHRVSGVPVTEAKLVYQSIVDELIVELGKLGDNRSLNTTELTDWYVKKLEEKSKSKQFLSVFSNND